MSPRRPYDALLLDLDGTLVGESDCVRPRVRAALAELLRRGVHVMIATGRSEAGVRELLRELEITTPALVYNGAGLWDPVQERLIEERVLSGTTCARTLRVAAERGFSAVVQRCQEKFAYAPRSPAERLAFEGWHAITLVDADEPLPVEFALRVTLFSELHADSVEFARDVERAVDRPLYITHFPLDALAAHRGSPLQVLDVQPPCRGKAEALRYLQDEHGIAAERVVAVGDASNDVPMLREAGLGVAVHGGMRDALEVADRVIGEVTSDALADLVEELFLLDSRSSA